MKYFLLFLFTIPLAPFLFSQSLPDSLAILQVDSLIQVSREHTAKNDFDKALEVNTSAEKIALDHLGRASAAYGSVCHNFGRIFYFSGHYPESEKWYLDAISIREKALGKLDPEYASSLHNLAATYRYLGAYDKAEPLYLQALIIREKTVGKMHLDYAENLGNLAALYRYMGDYDKAESLFWEAKNIREKLLGKNHPSNGWSIHNLANLYRTMGNYKKAEPLFLEAIAIWEKSPGKESSSYAWGINNLANLYLEMGAYDKALPLFLEAKDIRKKSVGKTHPDYAWSLQNLANLYRDMGEYAKAEPLYLEAKAIWEKAIVRMHPDFATNLNNLATLYRLIGDYDKAKPLYLEAKDIRQKVLIKGHPDYAQSLYDMAALYQDMGDDQMAESMFEELATTNQTILDRALHFLSEQEMYNYLQKFELSHAQTLCFAWQTQSKRSVSTCYDNCLFYKGLLLNVTAKMNWFAQTDTSASQKINQLHACKNRLGAQYTLPISMRDSSKTAAFDLLVNDLEKELARTVAGYAEAVRPVGWEAVKQQLKTGEAAIEFVHFKDQHNKQTNKILYAALIICPHFSNPVFIPLFEEKQLESLLSSSGVRRSDYVNGIYSIQHATEKSLYDLVWQPLENTLSGVKTIYFSPSGLLHRINLAAVPTSETENLGDRFQFVELGSTRHLVVTGAQNFIKSYNTDALLLGGIQYALDTSAIGTTHVDLQNGMAANRSVLSFESADSTFRGGTWTYLPSTEKEINSIVPILSSAGLKPTARSGVWATEEFFKSIGSGQASPRILHIATHGYFFPDPHETTKGSASCLGAEPVFKLSDHPMIRSGLILAGANQAWKTGKPFKPGMEDGILTAYEISQMDLSNTELVVLSACETGLGDIQGNEGVYGLQRAFKIAGAKYLIMSLWQVPDFQTQELMTAFYTNWLTKKQPIPDAFRAAQQAMREKYEHPYFWAGFVLVE